MSQNDTAAGPYQRAAPLYRAAGWRGALPLGKKPGEKWPPPTGWTGHGAPDPSAADVAAWRETHGDRNIGLRLPDGVIGLDVDAYAGKRGAESLADLVARHGELPPTWVTSARTDGISGIRLYRVRRHPDGRELNWPGEAGKHIEIIQSGHRYAIVWPSTNPEAGGATYQWEFQGGDRYHDHLGIPTPGELPELPEPWVRGLALPYDRTAKADLPSGDLANWWAALRGGHYCEPVLHLFERAARALAEVDGSRHETARDALAALVRMGGEGHRAVPAAVGNLEAAFANAVGPERAASGEWQRLLTGAVKLAATDNPTPQQHCQHDAATPVSGPEGFDLSGFTVPGAASSDDPPSAPGGLNLPDHFWSARESLKRIRQAAHSRVRSGDVVFYGMLCRLAAMAPHTLRADTGVGTAASLNLFAAIVGPSGGGKSSGLSVSRNLIKVDHALEEFPLGSGEGIAEAYMGDAEVGTGEMDRHGAEKTKRIRKQVRHRALFYADEGNALNKLLERTGSIVGETLRSTWSGEMIGQKNGRAETTRTIPSGAYSAGLVIGYQPSTVLPLLADHEAGTPQRFLYCWAVDPSIPGRHDRVPWPGEMVSPFPAHVPTSLPPPGSVFPAPAQPDLVPITFAASIVDELYDLEHAKNTGALPAEHPLRHHMRSQHPVLKVKIASLLALLEQRRNVTEDDWQLAQLVIETSDRVREYLEALAQAAAGKARAASLAAEAEAEHYRAHARASVSASLDATAERRLAVRAAVWVHESGPLTLGALRKRAASRDRPLVESAVEIAVSAGWLAAGDDGRVHPGVSRPAG